MKGIVQTIFKEFFPLFKEKNKIRAEVGKAANAISRCRTHEMGYHYDVCPDPDHSYSELYFNSCHHRSCPMCNFVKNEQWLKQKTLRMIACDYYHVVFTVPHELIPLWQYNRNLFMKLMFKASWESLKDFFLDEAFVGGLPGAIATFQSWDQRIAIHPHIHFLITAGGLAADGTWKSPTRKNYLLPCRALATKFRGKFLTYLEKALKPSCRKGKPPEALMLPQDVTDSTRYFRDLHALYKKKWSNAILGPYDHGRGVASYLGRYIRGGPLNEGRIVSNDETRVIISYKRNGEYDVSDKPELKAFELPTLEFIRRFTEHIPPRGSYTSRTFGLFNPANEKLLNKARAHFGQLTLERAKEEEKTRETSGSVSVRRCPICNKELIAIYPDFGFNPRAPPSEFH